MPGGPAASGNRLGPWLTTPDQAGVIVDFDGTLSPIVDDYDAARPLDGTAELLARLGSRLALVAVVSGRPLRYLQEHLAASGATILVGLYGLERAAGDGSGRVVAPGAEDWAGAMDAAYRAAADAAPPGVKVEHKGLSVTVHYRLEPDAASWSRQFADEQARALGLHAHSGKMSVELRPPVPIDKGTVVRDLRDRLGAVCYIGDDTGDLPAFAELSRMRESEGTVTLSVAVASDETPHELLQAADLVVDGPVAVLQLLASMAAD